MTAADWRTFDGDPPGVLHDGVVHLGVCDATDEVFVVVLSAGVQRQHTGRLVTVQRCLKTGERRVGLPRLRGLACAVCSLYT